MVLMANKENIFSLIAAGADVGGRISASIYMI